MSFLGLRRGFFSSGVIRVCLRFEGNLFCCNDMLIIVVMGDDSLLMNFFKSVDGNGFRE